MKNIAVYLSALVALLFSVAETSAQITPPYYNPANVRITGGTINGTTVGATTAAAGSFTTATMGSGISGLKLQPHTSGLYGAIYSTNVTPGAANYAVVSDGATSYINGTSNVYLNVNGVTKFSASPTLNTAVAPVAVTDTTDSSSTTTGSLKTAGGLGVVKKAYFGDTVNASTASSGFTAGTAGTYGFYANGDTTSFMQIFGASGGSPYVIRMVVNGTEQAQFNTTGLTVANNKTLQVGSGSTTSAGLIAGYYGSSGYGAIWSTGVTPSTTNHAFASNGATTGINATSSLSFTISGANALALSTSGAQFFADLFLPKTITAAGTTGAQTINKTTGRVNFAAGAASLVVTNSLVTANSIVHCTVATNDTTMKSASCVPAAGSFTARGNAVPTAETAMAFTVTN